MRKLLTAVALGLIVAACGGAESQSDQTSAPANEAVAPSSDNPATDAAPSFDGPPAPDFELALADGSTFALSAEQKPVYVVFWAEW